MLRGLGSERFSALTLAWALVGYLLLFDFGFSRAVTQRAAQLLSLHQKMRIRNYFWSANWTLCILGIGIVLISAPLIPQFVGRLEVSSEALRSELILSGEILLLSVPILLWTAQFRGLLEAYQKFGALSVLQLLTGTLSSLIPLLFLSQERALAWAIGSIVCLRVIALCAHAWILFVADREVTRPSGLCWQEVRELWKFSSWITVSNIVGPLMVSFDRFALSLLVPLANVASYTTPMEMVTKLWIIPSSVTRVLFPSFSGTSDISRLETAYLKSLQWTALIILPILVGGTLVASPLLVWWLGQDFANEASLCFQILLLGVTFNSLAWLPFTLLHSRGLSRPVAFLHLAELPLYFAVFFLLTRQFGIPGAAGAWTLRCLGDALGLFIFTARFFQREKGKT